MPTIDVNGTRIHYVEQGSGPETVVFSHSYLLDGSHFQPVDRRNKGGLECAASRHKRLVPRNWALNMSPMGQEAYRSRVP